MFRFSSQTIPAVCVLHSLMLGHPRTFCSLPGSLALFVLLGAPALCNPILFTFSGNVDATTFGLSVSTPFSIQYAYDPTQAPFAGSNASYPIDFVLTVGGYVTHAHGALDIVIQPTYDQFELNAAGFVTYFPGYFGQLTGDINGIPVWDVDLDILDTIPPIDMFSTTHLPASAQFLNSADFFQLQIENFSGTANILQRFGPSDLRLSVQPIPEPRSALLLAGGLLILMFCGFAKACR